MDEGSVLQQNACTISTNLLVGTGKGRGNYIFDAFVKGVENTGIGRASNVSLV